MSEAGTTLSPVRQWVQSQLKQLIPNNEGTIRSDTNGALFEKWTGWTNIGLKEQWASEAGTGAVTTSCNAFLGRLVFKIREAGGLATGASFHSFNLPKAGGPAWHWAGDQNQQPQPGDFFQIGTPGPDLSQADKGGTFKHVGVILDIDYIIWITVEGGQGGPKSGFDFIKRKVQVRPSGLMGWINIDEYFAGWKGSSAASA
jgi:hypothetical protein